MKTEPELQKYLSENLGKKSIKEMARELGLKEKKIRKLLEKNRPSFNKNNSYIWLLLLFIIMAGLVVYGNSLSGKFIYDDKTLVTNNVFIKDWSYFPRLFQGAGISHNFYRPLQMLTYMIDYFLWGLDPLGYHISNIILHVLAALSLFWLIYLLFANKILSFFTSLLFIVHPVHVEAVTYISGRADPLGFIFAVLCLSFYVKYTNIKSAKALITVGLLYVLAIFAKESFLIIPVLALLYHHFFGKKLDIKKFTALLAITFFYIVLRLTLLNSLLPDATRSHTFFQRLPGAFVAIADYLRILTLPLNLHMEYGSKLFSFSDPKAVAGIIALSLLLFISAKGKDRNRLISFSIAWFFIALLPVLNIFPVNAYMAEHWLYLPSVGFFLILAWLLNILYRREKSKILSIILMSVLALFYSYLTVKQNLYWKEPIDFYERTLRYSPDSARIYVNLGILYRKNNRIEESIKLYKKALTLEPNSAETYNNLGVAYDDVGKEDKAMASFEMAIKLDPEYSDAYNNLGFIYYKRGMGGKAMAIFKKVTELNPFHANAYNNLGAVHKNMGEYEKAIICFKRAIELDPQYTNARRNLEDTYREVGYK
jgi:Tfp pilus assembly protein PilF